MDAIIAFIFLLDDDGDGSLRGAELHGLALWNDRDADGVSDPGEVRPVAAHGIAALSTRSQTHSTGIRCSPSGVTMEDGGTRPTYDLILESR